MNRSLMQIPEHCSELLIPRKIFFLEAVLDETDECVGGSLRIGSPGRPFLNEGNRAGEGTRYCP